MKKFERLWMYTIFVFIFINSYNDSYANHENKSILILNSYHRGLEWNEKIETGILSELKKRKDEKMDIKIEYIDSKDNWDKIYHEKLVDLYKYKYKDKKFDLIIGSDNEAFDFLVKHRKEIFPNVPVVFCGVNNFDAYNLKNIHDMTGVEEETYIKDNIDLILKLHPNTKKIVAIMDNTSLGELLYSDLKNVKAENKYNIPIDVIKENYLKEIVNKVKTLSSDSVIFSMATSLNDYKGHKIYASESLDYMKDNTTAPIYGLWGTQIGYGIVGGKITSAFEQGQYAGKIALKVLSGQSISNIPIQRIDGNYTFDNNQLKRFSISEKQLPKNSIVVNKSQFVYSIAKDKLEKTVYAIICIFTLIIILLFISIIKRKNLSQKLYESRKDLEKNLKVLRSLLDTIPNPIFYKNAEGKYVECNTHFEDFVGLKKEDIINKTVFEMDKISLEKMHYLEDGKLMRTGGKQIYETKVKFSDGSDKEIIFSKAAIMSSENNIEGIVGIMLDITERKKAEENILRVSKIKEAMLVVGQSIIGINNTSELFNLILEKAIASMEKASYGSILILDKDRNLKIAASIGYDKEKVKEFSIPLERSFSWLEAKGNLQKTVVINDVSKLKDCIKTEIKKEDGEWDIQSCISSPIIINNELYGILNIDSEKSDAFKEEDLEIMEYMRNQIEIFINKHLLYEKTVYLSRYDKLTNIYNRRHFEEIFYKQLKNIKQFNLVVFDLNELKMINDNYGHLAGDEYIKMFVDETKKIIRSTDILARYGGDEFIALFSNSNFESLKNKFEDLLNYLSNNPMQIENENIFCSFSYGIANFPNDSIEYEALIKIADDRMYEYKKNIKKSNKSTVMQKEGHE